MASPIADMMHTAFSNLFVQTELLKEQGAILCHRRARSQGENNPWMFHMMAVHGATIEDLSYETDRARFVGRGNTPRDPSAMRKLAALSNSEGSVLDPIVAICHPVDSGAGRKRHYQYSDWYPRESRRLYSSCR
jgi:cyclic beta-1,2-glucan synthetase